MTSSSTGYSTSDVIMYWVYSSSQELCIGWSKFCSNGKCHTGSHYYDYYPGGLSLNQVSATHLSLKSTGDRSSNELQVLQYMIRYQASGPSNDYHTTCPMVVVSCVADSYQRIYFIDRVAINHTFAACASELTLKNMGKITTVTPWRLQSTATRLQLLQADEKENIRVPHQWPFMRASVGDRWIPLTKSKSWWKCFHAIRSSSINPEEYG